MLHRALFSQWTAIGFIGVVSLLLSVFIARRFGPEAFGVYAQALALGGILTIFLDSGFSKVIFREVARASPHLKKYAPNLHRYALGHAITFIFILCLGGLLLPLPLHKPTLVATVLAFGLAVIIGFYQAYLRGEGRFMREAAWQVANRALTAIFIGLALLLGADAPWHVLGAQAAGALLFLTFLMRKQMIIPMVVVPREVYFGIWPLIWLDIATVVYFRADMLMFKIMDVDRADVGSYGLAFRLIEAFLLLASPVGLLLFRRFRTNIEEFNNKAFSWVYKLALIAAIIGLSIFLGAVFFSDWFFTSFFGESYAKSGALFILLSLMLVFALANGVLGQAVFAVGRERGLAYLATFTAIFNILGNMLFIPEYGVWAAAWMKVMTEVMLGVGLLLILHFARVRVLKS